MVTYLAARLGVERGAAENHIDPIAGRRTIDTLSFELAEGEGGGPYSDLGATVALTDADPTDSVATLLYTADGGTGIDTVMFAASDGMNTSSYGAVSITVSAATDLAVDLAGTLVSTGDYVFIADDPLLDMTVMTMPASA